MKQTKSAPGGAAVKKSPNLGAILAIYLFGLLVGGLYVGMVSPVRTVVQATFGLNDEVGIWMINIYTLFYGSSAFLVGSTVWGGLG